MTSVETTTLVLGVAGSVMGAIGTALGVVNTITELRRDRVRLRIAEERTETGVCFTVTNLGAFPVTVMEIGFMRGDKRRAGQDSPERVPAVRPFGDSGLPQRLEPRTALTLLPEPRTVHRGHHYGADLAYAKTACGQIRTSPIAREVLEVMADVARTEQAPPPDDAGDQ